MISGPVLIIVGLILAVLGLARARSPWTRYQALRDQEENIARYESWRGGLRETGPTGASVAMAMLRRQAVTYAGVAAIGLVLALVGLFSK